MDRLVKPDVKEIEIAFKGSKKSTATFRLTNLMHTMTVAVNLTTTNPSIFSFAQPFSTIPPLSSASYTLILLPQSQHPPLSTPVVTISVNSALLPIGKAPVDDLRRLFSRPGPHVFRDASIPIYLVGCRVVEYLIDNQTKISLINSYFSKAASGCTGSQLTALLKSALQSGNANLISCLIDEGADVNFKDSDGRSMINLAIKAGNINAVKILIAAGCQIDDSIDHVLHQAAEMNRVDLMEVLYANFNKIDVNSVDSTGRTAIHVAAIHGHADAIKFCNSVGGKADVFDSDGYSPLHAAAERGELEAVECLLNCSEFVKHALTKDKKTAFAIAVENGHSHLYELLHLGDVLQRAARAGDVSAIKACLAEGVNVNGRDQNGWTALHRSAFKGRIESVKVLLNHGAQVDAVDDAGFTPLHCAVEAGHVQVALLLISHGAKANVKSLKGLLPCNLNCFKNDCSIVKSLCEEKECALNVN